MQDANVVYFVRFWIKPGNEAKVFDWLDGDHIRHVVAQPGFLWVRRYKLEQSSEDGWPGYTMIYGLESLDHLNAYFESDAVKQYAKERQELGLDPLLRMDRAWGTCDLSIDA
jgi:antibiotic biosynthesis monooxygenase (ABM) superfamily enzyme